MERIGFAVLLVMLSTLGCSRPQRPLVTHEATRALPAAERTTIEIELAGGLLDLAVGAPDSIGAIFQYDHEDMKPDIVVVEEEDGVTARVVAESPGWKVGIGPTMNLWRVSLPPDRPLDVVIVLGGGQLKFPALPLTLSSIDARVRFGNGEATFDFSETRWTGTLETSLEVGNGPGTRIIVPKGVGVRLQAIHSVGTIDVPDLEKQNDETWTNAAYGDADRKLELFARVSAGDLTVVTASDDAGDETTTTDD